MNRDTCNNDLIHVQDRLLTATNLKCVGTLTLSQLLDPNPISFSLKKSADIRFEDAEFFLKPDPYSGEQTLEGIWRDEQKMKRGSILFHSDGTFYAEWDVVSPHPNKASWFVEAVTAWGKDDLVKSEPRLLPVIG